MMILRHLFLHFLNFLLINSLPLRISQLLTEQQLLLEYNINFNKTADACNDFYSYACGNGLNLAQNQKKVLKYHIALVRSELQKKFKFMADTKLLNKNKNLADIDIQDNSYLNDIRKTEILLNAPRNVTQANISSFTPFTSNLIHGQVGEMFKLMENVYLKFKHHKNQIEQKHLMTGFQYTRGAAIFKRIFNEIKSKYISLIKKNSVINKWVMVDFKASIDSMYKSYIESIMKPNNIGDLYLFDKKYKYCDAVSGLEVPSMRTMTCLIYAYLQINNETLVQSGYIPFSNNRFDIKTEEIPLYFLSSDMVRAPQLFATVGYKISKMMANELSRSIERTPQSRFWVNYIYCIRSIQREYKALNVTNPREAAINHLALKIVHDHFDRKLHDDLNKNFVAWSNITNHQAFFTSFASNYCKKSTMPSDEKNVESAWSINGFNDAFQCGIQKSTIENHTYMKCDKLINF